MFPANLGEWWGKDESDEQMIEKRFVGNRESWEEQSNKVIVLHKWMCVMDTFFFYKY